MSSRSFCAFLHSCILFATNNASIVLLFFLNPYCVFIRRWSKVLASLLCIAAAIISHSSQRLSFVDSISPVAIPPHSTTESIFKEPRSIRGRQGLGSEASRRASRGHERHHRHVRARAALRCTRGCPLRHGRPSYRHSVLVHGRLSGHGAVV